MQDLAPAPKKPPLHWATDEGWETQRAVCPGGPGVIWSGQLMVTIMLHHVQKLDGWVPPALSGFLNYLNSCLYLLSKAQGWGNQRWKQTFSLSKGRHCAPCSHRVGPLNTFWTWRLNLTQIPFPQPQPNCCWISTLFKLWKGLVSVFSWKRFFSLPFNQLISQ